MGYNFYSDIRPQVFPQLFVGRNEHERLLSNHTQPSMIGKPIAAPLNEAGV